MNDDSIEDSLRHLHEISKKDPAIAKESIGTIQSFLLSSNHALKLTSIQILWNIAEDYPEDVATVFGDIIGLLDDENEEIQKYTLFTLADIALIKPERVCSVSNQVHRLLNSNNTYVRLGAIWVLNNIALEYPKEAIPALDDIKRLVKADHERIRVHAVSTIACIALVDSEAVGAVIPHIEELQNDESDSVRDSAELAINNFQQDDCELKLKTLFSDDNCESVVAPAEILSASEYRPKNNSEITKSVNADYVSTLCELVNHQIDNAPSVKDCQIYVEELRDVLVELNVNGTTYEELLTNLNKEIDRLSDSSFPDEMGEERQKRLKIMVHRVNKFLQRQER